MFEDVWSSVGLCDGGTGDCGQVECVLGWKGNSRACWGLWGTHVNSHVDWPLFLLIFCGLSASWSSVASTPLEWSAILCSFLARWVRKCHFLWQLDVPLASEWSWSPGCRTGGQMQSEADSPMSPLLSEVARRSGLYLQKVRPGQSSLECAGAANSLNAPCQEINRPWGQFLREKSIPTHLPLSPLDGLYHKVKAKPPHTAFLGLVLLSGQSLPTSWLTMGPLVIPARGLPACQFSPPSLGPCCPCCLSCSYSPKAVKSPCPGGKDPLKMHIWVITASPESLACTRHYDACQIPKNPTKRICY